MSLDDNEKENEMGGLDEGLDTGMGLEKKDEDEKTVNPSDALTVAGALAAIAGRDKFADVHFLVGTGKEQRRIPAHRVVLAASSDIFEGMLYPIEFPEEKEEKKDKKKDEDKMKDDKLKDDKMKDDKGKDTKDSKSEKKTDDDQEIEIPDVKPSVFRTMLQCVYGDTADIKAEELPEVIACAKKFQLEGLRQLCVTFMEEGVTVENACALFESAQQLLNEKHFALSFIEENAQDVVSSPSFDTLSKDRIMSILKSNKLAIDEIDLFQGVLRWAVSECKRQNLENKPENKKAILKDIIPLIRFPTMNMEDIATSVSPSGLLEASQLLEIFTYLGQPDNKKPKTQFPTQSRAGSVDKWTIDPTLKTSTNILSNNNLTCRSTGGSHSYCLGSQVWTKGKHAWRITRDSGGTQWFLVGVSRKEVHQDNSYNQATVWALSSANQRYMGGVSTTMTSNFNNGPLDVLLDCDERKCTIVNLSSPSTPYELTGIPKNTPLCPHFGPHSTQQFTVAPIKVRSFGQQ